MLVAFLLTALGIAAPPAAPWFPKAPALPRPTGEIIRELVFEVFEES